MMGLVTSKTARPFLKETQNFFRKKGWRVLETGSIQSDFRIELGLFRFNVQIVDQSVLRIKPYEGIRESMEGDARTFQYKNGPMMFLLNFEPPLVFRQNIAASSLSAFTKSELSIAASLINFLDDPARADSRNTELVLRTPWLCLRVAESLHQRGDIQESIRWLHASLRYAFRIGGLHHTVVNTLIKAGEKDSAYKIAADAVLISRGDKLLLETLIKLSTERGDARASDRWKVQLEDASPI
jgi:hypothetical protein